MATFVLGENGLEEIFEETFGDTAIQKAMNINWGVYDKFFVNTFPNHCFYKRIFFDMKKTLYVLGIRCTAFKQPFDIILEAMSFYTGDNILIRLSAYSPTTVTNGKSGIYYKFKYVLDWIKEEPSLPHQYEFEMQESRYDGNVGLCLYTEYEYSLYKNNYNAHAAVFRSFFDEAGMLFGFAIDYLYSEGY